MPMLRQVDAKYLEQVKVGDVLWVVYGYSGTEPTPRTVSRVTPAQIEAYFTNVHGDVRKTRFWKKPTSKYSVRAGGEIGGFSWISGIASATELADFEAQTAAEKAEQATEDAADAARHALDRATSDLFSNALARIQEDGTWHLVINKLTLAGVKRIAAILQIPEHGGNCEVPE